MNQQVLSSLIWSVADLLRGDFKQSEYGRVILPFTVLRRLDCVLAPTKEAALKEHVDKVRQLIAFEPFVKRKTGLDFYNVSSLDMGKLMESEKLQEQAANNTKEQFAASPDLANEILGAVMDALTAHTAMSKQALESEKLRADMKEVLLGAGKLWEGLSERAAGATQPSEP